MSDQHTHPKLGLDGADLTHDHNRGDEGHTHAEPIEAVIAAMLDAKRYTGLTPRHQRVVAVGIAALRRALVDVAMSSDAALAPYPPPTTGQLRAPLVSRRKGDRQPPPPLRNADRWTISPTARCGTCGQSTRRRTNSDTGRQYGPAVIFHLDECPERPIGRRA